MGKYDNFNNAKRIRKARRKLKRRTRCLFKSQSRIAKAQAELDTAKLFESCQIFKSWHGAAPNKNVMFSDDNRVMMFYDRLIRYDDIQSYRIVERIVSKSHTVTRQSGAIPRAIVGHAIAGDLGAIVGAMSADSHSQTTYYNTGKGFIFQVFRKDGSGCQIDVESIRDFSNKIHPKWLEVGAKIQRIIDGKN